MSDYWEENVRSLQLSISGLQKEIKAAEDIIRERKARLRECRRDLAYNRGYLKQKQRRQAAPEYKEVLARKAARDARQAEAVQMHEAGLTFVEIAQALGFSTGTVSQVVRRAKRIADYRAWKAEQEAEAQS